MWQDMAKSTPMSWRSASQRINRAVSKSPIRMRFPLRKMAAGVTSTGICSMCGSSSQYLAVPSFSDATAQAIFNEALKYQGWKYVYGGSNPNTSFDCSGLVQWCYGKAGISLPRTAQAQYDATQHIPLSQAKAGDLVFFHSTYNAGTYVTHVGIYAGNNRMYHAGDPIGYADLTSSYWQQHLIGAGRVKQNRKEWCYDI